MSLVQSPAQSTLINEIRPGCSVPCLVRAWKPPRRKTVQLQWATCSRLDCLHSEKNFSLCLCSLSVSQLSAMHHCKESGYIFSITSSWDASYLVPLKHSFLQAEQTHLSQVQRSKMLQVTCPRTECCRLQDEYNSLPATLWAQPSNQLSTRSAVQPPNCDVPAQTQEYCGRHCWEHY